MLLKDRIENDIKTAMRAQERARLSPLRMLSSALKDAEIDRGGALPEVEQYAVLNKLIKQRRESAEQYRKGGRAELAEAEASEADLLAEYLPPPLNEAELNEAIDWALAETGAEGLRDMGKVMECLKEQLQGRAEMEEISRRVKGRLSP